MNDLVKHLGIRIQEAVEEKNWAEVERRSKELLKYAPQKTLGFKWLARASLAQGKLERAAYAYNRILDFDSENEEAKKFFSEHVPQGNPKVSTPVEIPAEPELHILSPEQKHNLARAEFEAGIAYETVKMYEEAGEHFKKSFDWHPHPQAAYKAAESLHKAQKSYHAIKLLGETLNANANWVEGHMLAGQIYFDLGQLSSAQNEWQRVLKLDPGNTEALKRLRSTWDLDHR